MGKVLDTALLSKVVIGVETRVTGTPPRFDNELAAFYVMRKRWLSVRYAFGR